MAIEKIIGKLNIPKIEEVNSYANLYDMALNVRNEDKTRREVKFRVRFNHHYNISAKEFEPNAHQTLGKNDEVIRRLWDYKSLDESFTPFSTDIIPMAGKLDDKLKGEIRKYFNGKFRQNLQAWLQYTP